MIGPASDGRLAWKTNQATPQSADDLAAAVEEQVRRLAAPEDAPFLPLARAHAVVDILTRTQSPPRRIGVAVVATTDDQSPGPTKSYHLPPDVTTIGLAPSRRDAHGEIDPVVYPRLIDWSDGMLGSPFNPLERLPDAPYSLFESRWTGEWTPRCPGYAIAESSPGLGRCVIEMTTSDPLTCDPERGWVDPLASNGSRRPRVTQKGERICEIAPVDPRVMDACIHDETCPDCGAGWCITQFLPLGKFCPDRAPLPIRWVGGAVPSPGVVHITCLEPVDSAAH